jgi:hypothetical protein
VWDKNWLMIIPPLVGYLAVLGSVPLLSPIQRMLIYIAASSVFSSLICIQYGFLDPSNQLTIAMVQTALTIFFNVLATCLLAGRLLHHRRALRRAGLSARLYGSLTSVFVESAGLYTLCGALYLPFARARAGGPLALLLRGLSFLGPALIQLRIAEGTAFGALAEMSSPSMDTPVFASSRDAIVRHEPGELWYDKEHGKRKAPSQVRASSAPVCRPAHVGVITARFHPRKRHRANASCPT